MGRPPHRGRNARYVRSTSLLTVTRMSLKTTWIDTSTTVPRTPSLLSDLAPPESSHRHTHVLACTHLMHRHPCRSHAHLHCPGPMILCSLRNTPRSWVPPKPHPLYSALPGSLVQAGSFLQAVAGNSLRKWFERTEGEGGLPGTQGPSHPWSFCYLPATTHLWHSYTLMHTHTLLVPQSQFPGPPPSYLGSVFVYLPFPGVSLRQQHGCHSLFRSAVPTFTGSFLFPLPQPFLYG